MVLTGIRRTDSVCDQRQEVAVISGALWQCLWTSGQEHASKISWESGNRASAWTTSV